MGEQAYGYTLWKRRPGNLLGDKQVASATWYFDLSDRASVTSALDTLIERYGKGDTGRAGYWLQLSDPVTGETVRNVEPLEPEIPAGNGFALENVSDEALMREVLRRLTRR